MSEDFSRVMIFQEKHDTTYFAINNNEDKFRVALKVLRYRAETGYYYPTRESLESSLSIEKERLVKRYGGMDTIDDPELSFAGLPTVIKDSLISRLESYNKGLENLEYSWNKQFDFVDELNRLVSESDDEIACRMTYKTSSGRNVNLAFWLLESRSDHQYEGFEIEELERY